MQLDHQFSVPASIDEAWKVLLDVPSIAPCMPGAALTEFDGETFAGSVKVKLGPISLLYRGTGRFVEADEASHRLVMEASGKESRGSGTAAATVTATLSADGDATKVDVTTDLKVTGKPAQFGRGMLNDVGGKLLGQFAECVATKLAESGVTPATSPDDSPQEQAAEAEIEVEPIDLLEITGTQAALRRYGPYAAIAVLAVILWLVSRRRQR